jgi:hypothetical protein
MILRKRVGRCLRITSFLIQIEDRRLRNPRNEGIIEGIAQAGDTRARIGSEAIGAVITDGYCGDYFTRRRALEHQPLDAGSGSLTPSWIRFLPLPVPRTGCALSQVVTQLQNRSLCRSLQCHESGVGDAPPDFFFSMAEPRRRLRSIGRRSRSTIFSRSSSGNL